MTRTALTLAAAFAIACEPAGALDYAPTLDGVDADADARLALVDRDAVLAGALDWDVAPAGDALDADAAGDGFAMDVTDEETASLDDAAPSGGTYGNVVAGALAATAANVITAVVVTPPAAAIAIANQGTPEQLADNVWYVEDSATFGAQTVTAHWTVAWVGVGWLAEMRISDDSGRYDHHKWFSGFVAYGGGLGWWDIYGDSGELAGVVEWIGDGTDAQFGIAVTAGSAAGDWLSYSHIADVDRIDAWSEAEQEASWVEVQPDQSGEVRLPTYNGGEPACWGADLADVACE